MAEVRLGAGDGNRHVDASAGDHLVVALPESPSTGQSWFVEISKAAIVWLEGEAFDRTGPLVPGGAGTRRFRFLAVTAGEATLSFKLAFAGSGATTDTLTIHIVVR